MKDDPPPFGAGVETKIVMMSGVTILSAGTKARNWLPLTYVVGNGLAFQRTTEREEKFAPSTVSQKPAPPAGMLPGNRLVRVGAGAVSGGGKV